MKKPNFVLSLIILWCMFSMRDNALAEKNKAGQERKTMISNLSTEKRPHIKAGLIEKLGEMRTKEAVPEIIKSLQDVDLSVRMQACDALGKIGDKTSVPQLIEKLKDKRENWSIRVRAGESLSKMADSSVFQPLVQTLNNESGIMRKPEDIIPPPRHQHISLDEYIERAYADTLKKFIEKSEEKKSYMHSLQEQMHNTTLNVVFRYRLAVILGEMGERSSSPVLIECLKKCTRGEMKTRAAYLLGQLSAKESIPVLKEALSDNYLSLPVLVSEDVGRSMMQGMTLNNGKEIYSSAKFEKKEGYYNVYHFSVREASAAALKKLGVKVVKEGDGYKILK